MTPLLAQRVRGTDRAFERLYKRHAADVYRYSLAVLRNPSDAEDVTQTTFLNAYRAFQRGERPEKPQNWLIAIAHNVCRQRFRQAARRPNEVAFNEDIAEAVPLDTGRPSAEDLTRALGHLAFNQRSALVMRELEGRSYAEIAQALDISLSAVETLLFRARRAIREQLEGSLTCHEAELAISRQVDGRLARSERGPLRAHLRECSECATFARSQRAQRAAWKGLAAIPLPSSLASFFGGGGGTALGTGAAGAGLGLGAKAAAVATAAAVAGGVGYEGVKHPPWHAKRTAVAAKATRQHETPVARHTAVTVATPASEPSAPVPVSAPAKRSAEAKSKPGAKAKTKAQAKAKAKGRKGGRSARDKARAQRKEKKAKPSVTAAAVAEEPAARPDTEAASESVQEKHAKPAKPARVKHEGARSVGLARGERAARDKTKFSRPAVGLARSEERSKQKARSFEKKETAPTVPTAKKADDGVGSGGKGKRSDPGPDSGPEPQDIDGNGNGVDNGGNGQGSGNGKEK